jgi:hypothetical protein
VLRVVALKPLPTLETTLGSSGNSRWAWLNNHVRKLPQPFQGTWRTLQTGHQRAPRDSLVPTHNGD